MLFKQILLAGALQAALTSAIDVDVNGTPGGTVDRFENNHPKGNRVNHTRTHNSDHVNVDVNHQPKAGPGPTTVNGNVHASNANVDLNVDSDGQRTDRFKQNHPKGDRFNHTRTHDRDHDRVNVDVNRDHQNGKTTVGGDIQARGMGNAVFANRCDKDVWIWSVDEGGSSAPIQVAGRSRYIEPFRTPSAGGVVFKLSDSDQIVDGKHTQFEYAISNNQLYYDMSFVNCAKGESASDCPGHAKGLLMYSPGNDACGKADCAPDSYCPNQSYYVDTPLSKLGLAEPVFGCGAAGTGMDLYMIVCSENPQISKRSIAGRLAWEH